MRSLYCFRSHVKVHDWPGGDLHIHEPTVPTRHYLLCARQVAKFMPSNSFFVLGKLPSCCQAFPSVCQASCQVPTKQQLQCSRQVAKFLPSNSFYMLQAFWQVPAKQQLLCARQVAKFLPGILLYVLGKLPSSYQAFFSMCLAS